MEFFTSELLNLLVKTMSSIVKEFRVQLILTGWYKNHLFKIQIAVDINWLVQESPVQNPDCFGDISLIFKKRKTCYKVTAQTHYHKP